MEHLFGNVHDIENCFQRQFGPLEILHEHELASLDHECEVVIQHDINDSLNS